MRNVRGFGGVIAVAIAGVLGFASVAFACVPGHVMTPEEARAMGQPVPGDPAVPAPAVSPSGDAAPPVPATAAPRPAASPPSSTSASPTDSGSSGGSSVLPAALGVVGGAIAGGILAIMLTGRRSRRTLATAGL